jgi:hypothetical protein
MESPPVEGDGAADSPRDAASGRFVPVTEAIKYRRRAQQAETRLGQIEQKLTELQSQLDGRLDQLATAEAQRDELQHQLEGTRRRSSAQRALQEAGVTDVETAMALLEKRINLAEDVDPALLGQTVTRLAQEKPFLLGPPVPGPGKTAGARGQAAPALRLNRAAARAAASGNRRDIAEYLRLRRNAGK